MMYDWANSAFATTVVTVLLGPYLTALAQSSVGENGDVLSLGPLGHVTAKSLFPYAVSVSVACQVILLPLLGAVADYTNLKKPLMAAFCCLGSGATCLMLFVSSGRFLLGAALFIVANVGFGASIVLYNAYLNEITTEDLRDLISSGGYALGYLGGGLLLAANLVLISEASSFGISKGVAVRLSLASAGFWWGGFSIVTFRRLKSRAPAKRPPTDRSYLGLGIDELARAFRELRRLPRTLQYLIAYMAFNDAIQTVITISSVFLAQELFVAKGLPADESFLITLILMVQFVAFFGSLVFERVAARIGAKGAILVTLALWTGVIVYAYAALETTTQAWFMGAVIALVLGGSQALSRSLFSLMIPQGRASSFFGIYEISERGTSWIGPLIFGFVVAVTNSYRRAILSLIVLFGLGIVLLWRTDTVQAVRDAGNRLPRDPAEAPSFTS
jgi:UMF1 family MFS transporter